MQASNEALAAVCSSTGIERWRVEAVAALLGEGSTVPFVARYRKERTGGLDEVGIVTIRDSIARFEALEKRRAAVLSALAELGVTDEALLKRICGAPTLAELEDLYLPYRPKRRTRASIAREKGLGPLAEILMRQEDGDPAAAAAAFVDPESGVQDADEALAGARDVIAETVSEDAQSRSALRELFAAKAELESKLVKIDPKSIGVGQYQHDVSQPDLQRALDDVVVSCVNTVGVDEINRTVLIIKEDCPIYFHCAPDATRPGIEWSYTCCRSFWPFKGRIAYMSEPAFTHSCSICGESYTSREQFPSHSVCPRCMGAAPGAASRHPKTDDDREKRKKEKRKEKEAKKARRKNRKK